MDIKICKTALELKQFVDNQRNAGNTIGFVPTMGALHNGHISLIEKSKSNTNVTIVSIFVNPTQFNSAEDFAKYPITIEKDIELLQQANCEAVYLPSVSEIYPNGTQQLVHYDIDNLDTILEGKFRPGHFQGVCNVVYTLLQQVNAHQLFMGAKDYQQCMVVNKLIQITKMPLQLIVCDTLREKSGLAMSSRNARLSATAQEKAAIIYTCLQHIKTNQHVAFVTVKTQCDEWLIAAGFTLEYIVLAHATSLMELHEFEEQVPMVILFAAWLDGVRLIDNMVIN
jgi:pantoate--beta-alanine ligase